MVLRERDRVEGRRKWGETRKKEVIKEDIMILGFRYTIGIMSERYWC